MDKKKSLLIVLPIIILLVLAGILFALYFTTDMFKSADKIFVKYFTQNADMFKIMENSNIDVQKNLKTANNYQMNGELSVSIQNNATTRQIQATTSSRHDINTGRTYSDIVIKNGEEDLLNFSYINSNDVYAIKCNQIVNNYIGIRNNDLKSFAKNIGVTEENLQAIPDIIDFSNIKNLMELTQEQKDHIINTYSRVILESIEKDNFTKLGKQEVIVNNKNYTANAYQLELSNNALKNIIVNCLNTLKDDNITLVMISNKMTNLGIESEYIDITNLSNAISELANQLESEEVSDSNITTIKVYENKSNLIKTEIIFGEIAKVYIDKVNTNNEEQIIITLEDSNGEIATGELATEDAILSENVEETQNSIQSLQIILKKSQKDNSITNELTVIPNMNRAEESFTIRKSMGNVIENMVTNTSQIIINSLVNDSELQTIETLYTQDIQVVDQVEEIMELKNSNTVIINNYNLQQLAPFLTNLSNKIVEVLPNKFAQLGLALTVNQDGNELSSILENADSNTLISIISTGLSIANAN